MKSTIESSIARENNLAHVLRIAVEHLMRSGNPRQNLGQFLAIVADALEIERDGEELQRWREMYAERAEGE